MKQLIFTISAIILFTSCSKVDGVNPSQNEALNNVAGKQTTQKSGYMQKALDNWVKDDWTPSVEKNETIKKTNIDKDRDFKLQEYVDKIEAYSKEHTSNSQDSHVKKVDSMPVIGKK